MNVLKWEHEPNRDFYRTIKSGINYAICKATMGGKTWWKVRCPKDKDLLYREVPSVADGKKWAEQHFQDKFCNTYHREYSEAQ